MQDYVEHLAKLRHDANEWRALSEHPSSDSAKRELFGRVAAHLATLADEVEIVLREVQSMQTTASEPQVLTGKNWKA